jgi:hypothetical protein
MSDIRVYEAETNSFKLPRYNTITEKDRLHRESIMDQKILTHKEIVLSKNNFDRLGKLGAETKENANAIVEQEMERVFTNFNKN